MRISVGLIIFHLFFISTPSTPILLLSLFIIIIVVVVAAITKQESYFFSPFPNCLLIQGRTCFLCSLWRFRFGVGNTWIVNLKETIVQFLTEANFMRHGWYFFFFFLFLSTGYHLYDNSACVLSVGSHITLLFVTVGYFSTLSFNELGYSST